MQPRATLYHWHVENLKAVEAGVDHIASLIRSAVSTKNDEALIQTLTRILALLLGAWAECRLRKLLQEGHFVPAEIAQVTEAESQLERWETAVELAFRKHYKLPKADLMQALPHAALARYQSIREMLANDLKGLIGLRNKLAHGQWVKALNTDEDDISPDMMVAMKGENFVSLQSKRLLIGHLAEIIHDLVVSRATFERDFDRHFNATREVRRELGRRTMKEYCDNMRARAQRKRT